MRGGVQLLGAGNFENRIADRDALVANISARIIRRGGDQLPDNVLTLMAERTTQRIVGASTLHRDLLFDMICSLTVPIIAEKTKRCFSTPAVRFYRHSARKS